MAPTVSVSFQLSRLIDKKAEGSQLQILIYVDTRDPAYSIVNILHSYRLYKTSLNPDAGICIVNNKIYT